MHYHVIHISPRNKDMMLLTNKNLSFWSQKIAFYVNRKQKSYEQKVFWTNTEQSSRWFFRKKLETSFMSQAQWSCWHDICDFKEFEGVIYYKRFLYVPLGSTWLHILNVNTSQPSIYKTFWSQQDHHAYFKGLFMASSTNVFRSPSFYINSPMLSRKPPLH
jgi:hypothetical protein